MPRGIYKHKKGYHVSPQGRDNIVNARYGNKSRTGQKISPEEIEKRVSKFREEKSVKWKGENAGYRAKHYWVVKYYGQPTTCEHCQTGNLIGHQIHWANISSEYRRERNDWIRLCAKCHGLFDRQNQSRKPYKN